MSLLIDVSKLREPHRHVERTDEPSAFGADEIFRIVSPVELAFDLHKDQEKVRIAGTVKTALELDCSRCLEGFAVPIDASFDLLYIPASGAP